MNDPAQLRETHISVVLLMGDRAIKIKKPVRFPFVDLSTPELRKEACQREVDLNRRLAPDVYLGVADVVGPDGEVCDHVVVMRRMPAPRRLSELVVQHAVDEDDLRSLARVVTTFHDHAASSPTIAAAGRRDALRARWEAGFAEMRPFVGAVIDEGSEREIANLVRSYLAGREPLFDARIAAGRVIDGHGDLLADDVFMLDDGPRVLDCLEFDDQLRYGDVLADIAFLAMDLERLGANDAASTFLAAYRELAGETHPASLEHHYIAFRAHIRAKVACLRGDSESAAEAQTLHALALRHLREARVALSLVGGDPGAGKSTLAAGIADRTGWTVLRSDEVRKDLAGAGHADRMISEIGTGIYTDAATAATYTEMLRRARLLLERGESVVLDATWSDAQWRNGAAALATSTSSQLIEIRCDAPVEVRERRIRLREQTHQDPSDATVDVSRVMSSRAAPWPSATRIDTAQSVAAAIADALDAERSG